MPVTKPELYVAHIDSSIMFTGTKEECQAHRDALPFNTDCWRVSSIELYGAACYSDGYDEGYNAGMDSD